MKPFVCVWICADFVRVWGWPDFSSFCWFVALSRVVCVRAFVRYGDVSYYVLLRARDSYDTYVGHRATLMWVVQVSALGGCTCGKEAARCALI